MDIADIINKAHREVTANEPPSVLIRREYPTTVEDVWSACTEPDRLSRWFLPVTGELKVGGRYQLEGNAGGEILHCAPPELLHVTWGMGEGPASEVRLKLTQLDAETTSLELEHQRVGDPDFWSKYGPGSVGTGWDLILYGLAADLDGVDLSDRESWTRTQEYAEFVRVSTQAWAVAHEKSGASAEAAQSAAEETLRFFAPHAK
ncbi:MAG TPA: SRPBCC family protein [Pseudonocardiaceae bacterium]